MASYPPPNEIPSIFNPVNWQYASGNLTLADADARYLQLSGGTLRGMCFFNAALTTASISNGGFTFTMPSSSGQLALVSQLPSSLTYMDLTTAQIAAGDKTFSGITTISNSTQSTSDTTGALVVAGGLGVQKDSYFTGVANYNGITYYNTTANYNGAMAIGPTGSFTMSSGSAIASLSFGGLSNISLTLPTSAGQLSLVSQIPTNSTYLDYTTAQTGISGQKTFTSQILTNNGLRQAAGTYTAGSSSILTGTSLNSEACTFNNSFTAGSGTVTQVSDTSLAVKTHTATNSLITYTNAASLYIAGVPAASTNVTITNPYALQIDAGNAFLKAGSLIFGNSGFKNTLSTASLGSSVTLTLPAITDTLITKTSTDVLTNKSLSDTTSVFVNSSDNTKKAKFDLSGATASKTLTLAAPVTLDRTITFPDASDTLVCKSTNDVLTNKDLTSSTNSFPRSFVALTTTYRFINNQTLTAGATNNYVLSGNGTPAIPMSASAVLVTIYGTYSVDNAYTEATAGGNLASTTSSHTLFSQAQGGTRVYAATSLVVLNTSDGSIDVRVNTGNSTSTDASVIGYIY